MDNSHNKLTIDYGGTWVRLNLFSKNKETHSFKAPSPPLFKLPSLIRQCLIKWKITQLDLLIIGAKGVWKKSKKKALSSKLKKFARKVTVLSDVEMAYESAFGDNSGIILIAGTGSIAYGKDGNGYFSRAGGLGPQKGDEGSGYWMGKEYLKRTGVKDWSDRSVREVASLAKGIIRKAEKGNPLADQIVQEALKHLFDLVTTVSNKLKSKKRLSVAIHGGLFQNSYFKKLFLLQYNSIVVVS